MDNEEKILKLMGKVKVCIDKNESEQKNKKTLFNIFTILRDESEEVHLHSKFIYELLNINGTHDMGEVYLKSFLNIIQFEYTGMDLSKAKVKREYENIDILICLGNKAIMIENKIYAGDQENQLNRYNNKLLGKGYRDEDILIYYLTLDGHSPDTDSIKGLNKEINLISYDKEILCWIDTCISQSENYPAIKEILKQYEGVVKKLTNNSMEDKFKMELVELLMSEDNFKTALKINNVVNDAKLKIMKNFWEQLEKSLSPLMENKNCTLTNYNYYKNSIADYYKPGKKILSLTYLVKEVTEDINLYFTIEINWKLYYGFFLGKNQGNSSKIIRDIDNREVATEYCDNILKLNDSFHDKKSTSWLGWRYVYDKEVGNKYNFMEFDSDNTVNLSNEKYMEEIINSICEEIGELLNFK
jgi:hypothetical protein